MIKKLLILIAGLILFYPVQALAFATTSVPWISTDNTHAWMNLVNGVYPKVGIASSSPWGLLSVNPVALGSGVPEFVIGSSTTTHFKIDGNGNGTVAGNFTLGAGKVLFADTIQDLGGSVIIQPSGTRIAFFSSARGVFQQGEYDFGGNFTNTNASLTARSASAVTTFNALEAQNDGGTTLFEVQQSGNAGFGSTTPYATTSIQSNASVGDAFVVATSTGKAVFGVDNDGHNWTSGPSPVISSCGTGTGTVVGDDESGIVTTATAATACTVTFSKAYRYSPTCRVTDNSLVGFADIASVSTSAVTFGISSALTGGLLYYDCKYHQ